jgi:hypothetical protein
MLAYLCHSVEANAIIVLHACCHNPTGADLSAEQWQEVVACDPREKPDRVHRHGLSRLCRRHRRRRGCAEPVCRLRPAVFGVQQLFKVLLAVRRTGWRAHFESRKARKNPPACSRKSSASSAPTTPTRPPMAAPLLPPCYPSPALRQQWEAELGGMRERIRAMRVSLGRASWKGKNVRAGFFFRRETARHVFLHGPDRPSKLNNCVPSSAFMLSAPAASAWLRSTPKTSTTLPPPSHPSSAKSKRAKGIAGASPLWL